MRIQGLLLAVAATLTGCTPPRKELGHSGPEHAGHRNPDLIRFHVGEKEAGEDTLPMRLVRRLPGKTETVAEAIHVRAAAAMNGADIRSAQVFPDGRFYGIGLTCTPQGASKLREVTAANVRKKLVIVVDGHVLAAPVIAGPADGGRLAIRGELTRARARELAALINAAVAR